jgi:hypothetical protein
MPMRPECRVLMWVSVGRRGRPKKKGTAIMKLMTMTQVTVDGVMQGTAARRMRTAGTDSSAVDGPWGWATTRP